MLHQAAEQAATISGRGAEWRHRYADPEPKAVVKAVPVWLLHYPGAVIPEPGKSVIATWADPKLWEALQRIGIDLLHTCPVERAGQIVGEQYAPSIDGWFDRISMVIDPQLGTEQDYRQMVRVAREHGGAVGGDLVPLHTGLGADFRLAEQAYEDYPGAYVMVEIRPEDWSLLPEVAEPWATALVSRPSASELVRKGYIPGLINSADADPAARTWSGWSATGVVKGVDGRARRWVYLHVFKPGQPVLNWLDPSYAGRRIAVGDAVRHIRDLENRVVRLDAVPFVGIQPAPGVMAWYYMHPLSIVAAEDLAFTVRALGGWSFQELNVPLDQLQTFAKNGPDLAYDFFTRAQVLHPLITGDARLLRLAHRLLMQYGVPHASLIHDMQNHDEITYQLVNLAAQPRVELDGSPPESGEQLQKQVQQEMRASVAGAAAPYNLLYRPERDGLATTFAGFIAPALGIDDPYHASTEQVKLIERGHLLVAHANAMQPGVFGISSWDLVGALPIPKQAVAERITGGDYRWVNRGGVDLLDANPGAQHSVIGVPRAQALYGSLPQQLASPASFASELARMLAARHKYRLAESDVLAVPEVRDRAVCVLVMQLPDAGPFAITALNYGRGKASIDLDLTQTLKVPAARLGGRSARDIVSDSELGVVSPSGRLTVSLEPLSGRTLVLGDVQ